MIIDHRQYNVLAQQQHVVERPLTANRGEIYSADGYPLVINLDVYRMFIVPAEIGEKSKMRDFLVKLIIDLVLQEDNLTLYQDEKAEMDQDRWRERLEKLTLPSDLFNLRKIYFNLDEPDRAELLRDRLKDVIGGLLQQEENFFVQLLMNLEPAQKEFVAELNLTGVHFRHEAKRSYPEASLASHVLGFVGKDEFGQDKGYFGIEGYYDRDLSGRSGYELLERDVIGQRIPFGLSRVREPSHGRDLVLSIERGIQYELEHKLAEGVKKYGAKFGTVILMDPDTGAIWAMASAPDYLPEYWVEYLQNETDVSKVDAYQNPAISSNYEPGSVMKPFTMSAAIDLGLVTPSTVYQDSGPVEYSGYLVRTWNNKYHGEITMTRVLELSNNTGAAWVGHQVGFKKYAEHLKKFRLGQPTLIDLEGEEAGIVRDSSEWRDIDLANMAFGQGISLTPIQLATIFSALINGGHLYEPYLVKHLVDHRKEEPVVIDRQPKLLGQVIDSATSDRIRYMLRNVVTNGEFQWFIKDAGMDKYSLGGKTGTAQVPVDGRYDPQKTNTTFVGFMPVEDPEFVLLVRLNQPTSSTFSADTAVPLWLEMAKDLILHFAIPPVGG